MSLLTEMQRVMLTQYPQLGLSPSMENLQAQLVAHAAHNIIVNGIHDTDPVIDRFARFVASRYIHYSSQGWADLQVHNPSDFDPEWNAAR